MLVELVQSLTWPLLRQVSPAGAPQEARHCHGAQQQAGLLHSRPASAPSQQHFHEGAGAFTPMYMHAPEPLAF